MLTPADGLVGLLVGTAMHGLAARRGRSAHDLVPPPARPADPPRRVGGPVAVAQVAALLRAGATADDAWRGGAGVRAVAGVPDRPALAMHLGARDARAVAAAARLTTELGTPLADTLDHVGRAMDAAARAAAERDAALAGPAASARVLLWLPAAGLGLGWALGADPLGVLLGSTAGWTALAAAGALLGVGRRWTRGLVTAARRSGES